jgi:RNA polymerase sigma-70 factor (ECF subfamily)
MARERETYRKESAGRIDSTGEQTTWRQKFPAIVLSGTFLFEPVVSWEVRDAKVDRQGRRGDLDNALAALGGRVSPAGRVMAAHPAGESVSESLEERRRRFEALAAPLQHEIYRTAYRLCGHEEDARDVAQEAFVRAYQHFDRFAPGSNFRAWLHRILRNLFINRYHQARSRAEVPLEEIDPSGGPPADAAILREALDEEVERALAALGDDYRTVVVLADMQELSYEEISRALKIPLGTVRSRLFRARRLLQGSLREYARQRHLLPE